MSVARSSLLAFGLAFLPLVVADDHPVVQDDICNCFLTNSSENYFTNHMFYDFRNLGQYAGVPDILDDFNKSGSALPTSDYFNSDAWTSVWSVQRWNNSGKLGRDGNDATIRMTNSHSNVYIEKNNDPNPSSDTFLSFRTARLKNFQSSAEMESVSMGYHFVSVRMLARTIGDPGACTALFTYREADKYANVQEADIEVLTKDPDNRIQYTNQPSFDSKGNTIPSSTENGTLPSGVSWRQWAVHRLDWNSEKSTWLVDGQQVSSIKFQVPRDPSRVMINSWSDGGSWSGVMDVGGSAVLQIQWIEMIFNTTDSPTTPSKRSAVDQRHNHGPEGKLIRRKGDGQCQVVCSIDSAPAVGQVVMLHNGTAPGLLLAQSSTAAFWLPVLLMSAMFLHFVY
ncbi:xylanase 3 [Colletotrichum truncatum]|uniref:Xylanase 3 n=1 Tax=Colletotrichum truncatum TaxID=5467 RepID=A0ACC3YJE4_COLTU|nr:xylanase 3 [Colletotrichum truncatum]KAF6797273.1 xylanase 3 [Colletotrichum truncatum]